MQRLVLCAFFLMLAAPGCRIKQPDLSAEQAAIRAQDHECLAAAEAGNIERTLSSCWTDDGIVYAPNAAPVAGQAALRRMLDETTKIPGFRVTWRTDSIVVSAKGDMAYATGTNAFTMNDSTGRPVTTLGRVLGVWRKNSQGAWRIAVELWNSGPPEQAGRTP